MRIAITGASGTLGSALVGRLSDDFALSPVSGPTDATDLMDRDAVSRRLAGHDAVIHLAWRYARPECSPPSPAGDASGQTALGYYDNLTMTRHVLLAARAAGVRRAVIASSVHADYFYDWPGPGLIDVGRLPRGSGPYGSAKVLVEELGRELAGGGLSVVAVRYGGVRPDDRPHPTDAWERRVWLSHRDLAALIRAILGAQRPPDFALLYAVSDNVGRVHDVANPFGWRPIDRAAAPTDDEACP